MQHAAAADVCRGMFTIESKLCVDIAFTCECVSVSSEGGGQVAGDSVYSGCLSCHHILVDVMSHSEGQTSALHPHIASLKWFRNPIKYKIITLHLTQVKHGHNFLYITFFHR